MPSRRDALSTLGGAIALGLAGCMDAENTTGARRTDTEWPMAGHDRGGTGYARDAAAPRDGASVRWTREIDHPSARPVVAGGTVYIPTLGGLYAHDVKTGKRQWTHYPTGDEGQAWPTTPAVHDGTVYVGTETHGLLALSADDGSELWRMPTEGRIEAPPVPSYGWEEMYVGDDRGNLYCVRTALEETDTGRVAWTFDAFGGVKTIVTGHPQVYVGTSAGEVYSVYDGRGLWRRKLPGAIRSLVLGNAGPVYANTFGGGTFELLDGAHAGRTAWRNERGPVTHSGCVLAGGSLLGTDGSGLIALDRRSGETQWEVGDGFSADPAAAGDTVYVGGEDTITAYALGGGIGVDGLRFGTKRWSHDVEGTVLEGLAIADGAVFAVTGARDGSPATVCALESA